MSGPTGDEPPTGDLDGAMLRAAFRRGSGQDEGPAGAGGRVDADSFLDRVHRGGRRRRARRTAGAMLAGVASVGVVAAGVGTIADVGEPADVTAAGAQPVTSPAAAVYEIHAAEGSLWALGSRDCGRARYCPVVARSTDQGVTWDTDYPETADGQRAVPVVRHLGVSDRGTDVVVAGNGLATSHDAGQTWQRIEAFDEQEVTAVAVGAEEAVAAVEASGSSSLLTSPAGGDDWRNADVPVAADEQLRTPFAADDLVGATVASNRLLPVAEALVAREGGAQAWTRVDAPCRTRTPLVTTDGSTIWYLCYDNASSVLATSSDVSEQLAGTTWTSTDLPGARSAGLGAWGDGTAVVATDDEVFRVDAEGEVERLSGPGSGLRLARDDYSYRATTEDWLATFRGTLLHTTDNGETWAEAPAP